MISSSLLEKLVIGKKIDSQDKEKLRIVVLCDLECQAIVPLLAYALKAWNYFPEVFDLQYSDYQSFLVIYEKQIKAFNPDIFIIIQSDAYYLDEYQIVQPIEQVEKNVNFLKSKVSQVVHKIHDCFNQSKIIITTLPYKAICKKQYISFEHREKFDQIINDFTTFINDYGDNQHILDVGSYDGTIIEHIYDHHNSVASLEYLDFVTSEFLKLLRIILGKTLKCVITDLDNTLWDGVMADTPDEDKFKSKKTYYFLMYQKWLSFLYQQGIILCIASKNDEKFVKELFEKYDNILQIKYDQFLGKAINWQNKSSNIKYLCKFLNISEEHVLFIDDSKYECEEVKFNLLKISVFQFSDDIEANINQLIANDYFTKQQITETDYLRNKSYSANLQREALKNSFENPDDFLKKIKVTVSFTEEGIPHFARISDLSLRTNQFNMTTKRMKISEVENFLSNPSHKIIVYSCSDLFGDYGVIGCAFLLIDQNYCKIDNIIMSCRVFGRQVEYALMRIIMHVAKRYQVKTIIGEYRETVKNKKFESFYENCGFVKRGEDGLYEFCFDRHHFGDKHPYVKIMFD